MILATESWAEFGSYPKITAASQALQTAMICTMLGQPVPTTAHAD